MEGAGLWRATTTGHRSLNAWPAGRGDRVGLELQRTRCGKSIPLSTRARSSVDDHPREIVLSYEERGGHGGNNMKRQAIAISVLGTLVLLGVGGLATPAAAVPCHVTGTTPGGHAVSHTMGSGAVENAFEHLADAGWTDLTYDCH